MLPFSIWHWPVRGHPLPNRFGRDLNFLPQKFFYQSIGSVLYLSINYYNGFSIFYEPRAAYAPGSK
jgi:hypothetical protein